MSKEERKTPSGRLNGQRAEAARVEAALRESEETLRLALEAVAMGVWEWDLQTNRVYWSPECYRITGIKDYDGTVEGFNRTVHPDDIAPLWDQVNRAIETRTYFESEFRVLTPRGETRWVANMGNTLCDVEGTPLRMLGIVMDITRRKRTEQALQQTSQQLHALSASLQAAREEERTRISRELHDELGAALTSLRWELKHLGLLETESDAGEASAARREKIQAMTKLIDATTQTVRRISWDLRPSLLDDFGLEATMEWQAQQFESRTGIKCSLTASTKNIPLAPDKATAVFRIFQEALTNILRHAQATRVFVQLDVVGDDLVLRVRDNGRGLTPQQMTSPQSLGLVGMRERAHLMGATIRIYGSSRAGTFLSLRVPIEPQKESDINGA